MAARTKTCQARPPAVLVSPEADRSVPARFRGWGSSPQHPETQRAPVSGAASLIPSATQQALARGQRGGVRGATPGCFPPPSPPQVLAIQQIKRVPWHQAHAGTQPLPGGSNILLSPLHRALIAKLPSALPCLAPEHHATPALAGWLFPTQATFPAGRKPINQRENAGARLWGHGSGQGEREAFLPLH